MPHLTIEITRNLQAHAQADALLQAAHQSLLASGVFAAADVKSRLLWLDTFCVGQVEAADKAEGFIHARLDLLAGRPPEVRQQLAEAVVAAIKARVAPGLPVQISCLVGEMEHTNYAKYASHRS